MLNILLFQPGPLGDSFFTSGLSDLIKKEIPQSKVFLYTSPAAIEMVQDNNNLDGFFIHSGNLIKDIISLRKGQFDFVIDTWAVGNSYYRVLAVKSAEKISLRKKESEKYLIPLVYTRQVKYKNHGYVFWDRIELLKVLGINVNKYVKNILPVYHISEKIKLKILDFLNRNKINPYEYVIFSPKGLWKTKDVPVRVASKVIDLLQLELKIPVVLASSPGDLNYIENIVKLANSKPLVFSSKSIREFGGMIFFSKHLISVESLPYHLAVGLRKSATVILGGYPLWKPDNYKKLNYVNIEMDCKFCSSKTCKKKDYRCLEGIKPEWIVQKTLELI